jgi:hypothetical protein
MTKHSEDFQPTNPMVNQEPAFASDFAFDVEFAKARIERFNAQVAREAAREKERKAARRKERREELREELRAQRKMSEQMVRVFSKLAARKASGSFVIEVREGSIVRGSWQEGYFAPQNERVVWHNGDQ